MAPAVIYLVSPKASWINGQVFTLDDGRVQLMRGWHPVSGVNKGSLWEFDDMDLAFKRLFGTTTDMADEVRMNDDRQYKSISGIAARGRAEWL